MAKVVKQAGQADLARASRTCGATATGPQAAVKFRAAADAEGGTPAPIARPHRRRLAASARWARDPVPSGMEPMAVEVIATHAYKFPNNQCRACMLKNTHVPVVLLAQRRPRRTPSSSNASSTRWRTRRARTRWPSGRRPARPARTISACST